MLRFKNHVLLGSALAVVASLGVAHRAIALPGAGLGESQPQTIAQDVDPMQTRVPATVVAVDPDFGEIRVDLEDGTQDTIYLGNAEINELGLDVGEEVTVIYQDDNAIALIRGDEVVTLNANVDAETTTSTDMDETNVFESETETTTESDVSQSETTIQREETYQTTPRTTTQTTPGTTTQTTPRTTTTPAATEPVQGLW
ncbi:MAG: hypothetical protein VKK04_09000 [Synechococcales bacterium]|nr:hypothetical protein [Synechococcales bacterium]